MRTAPASLLLGSLLAIVPTSASGQISEYPVPTIASIPFDIVTGPDGNLWFTELQTGKIGRITPDGSITEFIGAGNWLHGITAGPDGAMWFTATDLGWIGRITTEGNVTSFSIPTPNGQPNMIVMGPDGNLWFTERTGGKVGRITPAGAVTEFVVSSPVDFLGGIQSITVGPDGNLWFTEAIFNANFVGRISTTGQVTKFPVPTANSYPDGIAAGADGNLWFTETGTSRIGRMTTDGVITGEFPTTSMGSPSFITAHTDGTLWFNEYYSGKVARITTDGAISEFPIPTPLSGPYGIASGRDGNVWFAEGQGNKIGRISPASGCAPDSGTLCLNAGRFLVTASWRAPSQGREGQAMAVSLTPDSGYFWFLEPSNIELVVKVLGACSTAGHHWVFAAGLTNLEVTLTVKDTATNQAQTYTNAAGVAFLPVQDTSTFACR